MIQDSLVTYSICKEIELLERIESSTINVVYLEPVFYSEDDPNDELYIDSEFEKINSILIQQARRILTNAGRLIVRVSAGREHKISSIANQVFGEYHRISQFIIPIHSAFQNNSIPTPNFELVSVYRKDKPFQFNKIPRKESELSKFYPHEDKIGKYRYETLFRNGTSMRFEFLGQSPKEGMSWKYSKSKMNQLMDDGLISRSKIGQLRLKRYLTKDNEFVRAPSIWSDIQEIKTNPFSSESDKFSPRIIKVCTNPNESIVGLGVRTVNMPLFAEKLNRKFYGASLELDFVKTVSECISRGVKVVTNTEIISKPILWNSYSLNLSEEQLLAIDEIISGENEEVEFKESACYNYRTNRIDKKMVDNIIIAINGFLNSKKGGKIFIGVQDDSTLVDLSANDYESANSQKCDRDGYELFLKDKINSGLGYSSLEKCRMLFHSLNGNEVCEIQVECSEKPSFFRGDIYVRFGNGKKKLKAEEFLSWLNSR